MMCPSDSQLTDLLSDALPKADARTIRIHLEKCSRCQARLDQLTDTPGLARKPQSTADLAVNQLDPLLHKLRQIPEQRPHTSQPQPTVSVPRQSALPVVGLAILICVGGGIWWWSGWRTTATGNNDPDVAQAKKQVATDRQYQSTLAEVDFRQPEQVQQNRSALDQLLSEYRTELAGLTSPGARAAEVAFRLAVLSAALEPPSAAINHMKKAIEFNSSWMGDESADRVQQCHAHLARLYQQTEQWSHADEHLRQQIDYWHPKWEARPMDLKLGRTVVALNRQLAEVRQKAGNWTGAEEACQAALNLLNMAVKSAPDSPFLQQELTQVQREMDTLKKRSADPGPPR